MSNELKEFIELLLKHPECVSKLKKVLAQEGNGVT